MSLYNARPFAMRLATTLIIALALGCQTRRPPSTDDDGGGGEDAAQGDAGTDAQADAGDAGSDAAADTGDAGSDVQDGGGNHAPSAAVTTPASGSGAIALDYVLFDAESNAITIAVAYSENGTDFFAATPLAGGTSGLSSSPFGVAHTFVWSSAADLPGRAATVRLRLTPNDGQAAGEAVLTSTFTVDNRPANSAPQAAWGTINSPVVGSTQLNFSAIDAESDTVNATVEYRVGTGVWNPITLAAGSGSLSALTSSPSGISHGFTWASATDVPGDANDARLRVTLNDGRSSGAPAESTSFTVRNAPRSFGVRFSEVTAGSPEWFELTNTGTSDVQVSGWKLLVSSQEATTPSEIALPTFQIGGGKRVLVTEEQGATTTTTVYLNQQIEWASAQPGSAALVNAQGQGVDFVRWGGSAVAPPAATGWTEREVVHIPHDGASIVRQGGRDTDSASDFCAAPSTRGGADDPCYAPPSPTVSVRLVEAFAGGATQPDPQNPGDWVEIYNSGSPIDLNNWVVATESGGGTSTAALRQVTVGGGARLRVVAGAGTDAAGLQYTGTTNLHLLLLSPGAVSLRDPTGRPHDYLRWYGWSGRAPPPIVWSEPSKLYAPGRFTALNRLSEPSTGTDASQWCLMRASPGGPGLGCIPSSAGAGIVINEVGMGGNFFTNGFIEIRNRGTSGVWMGDWKLSWGTDFIAFDDATMGAGDRSSVVECGILGGGAGCVQVFFPWGQFGGPAAGSLELVDNTGASIDFVRWGGNTDAPAHGGAWQDSPAALVTPATGDSVGRRESAGDTDRAADWCTQASTSGSANGTCR